MTRPITTPQEPTNPGSSLITAVRKGSYQEERELSGKKVISYQFVDIWIPDQVRYDAKTEHSVIPAGPGSGSRASAGIQRNNGFTLPITHHPLPFLDVGLVLSYPSPITRYSSPFLGLSQSTNQPFNCFSLPGLLPTTYYLLPTC